MDSCPALRREWRVCTVDASVACRGGSTWKADITSRPCIWLAQVRCLCRRRLGSSLDTVFASGTEFSPRGSCSHSESGQYFTHAQYLAFLFGVEVLPEEYVDLDSPGRLPERVSVFCGLTADTVHASVFAGSEKKFTHFLRAGGLRTPRSTLVGLLSVLRGCFSAEAFVGLRSAGR